MSGNRLLALISVLVLSVFSCRDARTQVEAVASIIEGSSVMSPAVTTTAFSPGGAIPKSYTCDGADTSPDLSWSGTLHPLQLRTRQYLLLEQIRLVLPNEEFCFL